MKKIILVFLLVLGFTSMVYAAQETFTLLVSQRQPVLIVPEGSWKITGFASNNMTAGDNVYLDCGLGSRHRMRLHAPDITEITNVEVLCTSTLYLTGNIANDVEVLLTYQPQ